MSPSHSISQPGRCTFIAKEEVFGSTQPRLFSTSHSRGGLCLHRRLSGCCDRPPNKSNVRKTGFFGSDVESTVHHRSRSWRRLFTLRLKSGSRVINAAVPLALSLLWSPRPTPPPMVCFHGGYKSHETLNTVDPSQPCLFGVSHRSASARQPRKMLSFWLRYKQLQANQDFLQACGSKNSNSPGWGNQLWLSRSFSPGAFSRGVPNGASIRVAIWLTALLQQGKKSSSCQLGSQGVIFT